MQCCINTGSPLWLVACNNPEVSMYPFWRWKSLHCRILWTRHYSTKLPEKRRSAFLRSFSSKVYHPPASSPHSSRDTFPLHMFSWLGVEHGHKHWSGWEICHGICSLNNTRENRLASHPALNSKSNGWVNQVIWAFITGPFPAICLICFLFLPLQFCSGVIYFSPCSFYFKFLSLPLVFFFYIFLLILLC